MADKIKTIVLTVTSAGAVTSGYEAVGFTPNTMFMTIDGGDIRYTYSPDQIPTTVHGHQLLDGSFITFSKTSHILNFRMVAQTTNVTTTITLEAA